jgi:DNA-binding NarL/FixJ family response regulator
LGRTDEAVLDALNHGARGYVDEAAPAGEFAKAIRTVDQGLLWASRRVLAMFVDRCIIANKRPLGKGEFTKREREVLEMLVAGRSNREIGVPLGIEERTVKAHVAKLMRKVGVQNRIALSVHALNHSIITAR